MSAEPASDADWDLIGDVISSEHRKLTLDRLSEGPATPTRIAEDVGLSVSHVSRALNTLRDKGLAELLVPEERRKGRIYDATDRGVEIAEQVADVDSVDGERGAQ